MEKLLWILICFGAVLVILGFITILIGIVVVRRAQPGTEAVPENNVWTVIAEKILGWFDKLIDLILNEDASQSRRLTALGLLLVLVGGLCIGGGVFGISWVDTAAAERAVAHAAWAAEPI